MRDDDEDRTRRRRSILVLASTAVFWTGWPRFANPQPAPDASDTRLWARLIAHTLCNGIDKDLGSMASELLGLGPRKTPSKMFHLRERDGTTHDIFVVT